MNRTGRTSPFNPATLFFSLPLAQAQQMSGRITATVETAAGPGEMLDERGHAALQDALSIELPNLSANEPLDLDAAITGTANMLATAQWRADGHRPGDTPSIGASTLAGALLIHLHSGPESLPARMITTARQEHEALFKHQFLWSKAPSEQAWWRFALLHRGQEHAMYDYWQGLLAQPES